MLGMAAVGWFLSAPFTQAAGKSTTLLPHGIFSWEYLGQTTKSSKDNLWPDSGLL